MTDDEIVGLGDYCEQLMFDPSFNLIAEQYEHQIVSHMLQTEPHETKKREGLYAQSQGFRDFLSHMKAIIGTRDEIIKPQAVSEFDPQSEDFE